MRIDRCTCYQQTFADLKTVADEVDAESVEELQVHVAFGHNCRLCHPYVRRMLRTGTTVFREVVRDAGQSHELSDAT